MKNNAPSTQIEQIETHIKEGNGDNSEMIIALIKALETKTDNKFNTVTQDIDKLQKMIDELSKEQGEMNKRVTYNKEQIDILFGKFADMEKKYQEGDKELQKQIDDLRKYVDDKLMELSAQLELLSANPSSGGGKVGEGDLKIIQDLIKRLTQLEKNFIDLNRRTDDISKDVDDIKGEMKNKANISDIDNIINRINELQSQIEELKRQLSSMNDKVNGHDSEIQTLKEKIRELNEHINALKNQIDHMGSNGPSAANLNIDMSKYLEVNTFNVYKQDSDNKFNTINEDLANIHKLIEQILQMLNNKADKSDLDKLSDFLLSKIQELADACNKKFADKNEVAKSIQYLESQIKKILSLLESRDLHGDNWLLAKKPLNGFSCASCEAYIGELHDNTQYVPWNKYPLRDPNEKLYRIGTGFSKMLQMLNVDGGVNNYNTSENNDSVGNSKEQQKNQTSTGFYKKREFGKDIDTHNNNNRQASASIKKIKAFPKVYNIKKDVNQNEKSREDEEGPHITKIFRKAKK